MNRRRALAAFFGVAATAAAQTTVITPNAGAGQCPVCGTPHVGTPGNPHFEPCAWVVDVNNLQGQTNAGINPPQLVQPGCISTVALVQCSNSKCRAAFYVPVTNS